MVQNINTRSDQRTFTFILFFPLLTIFYCSFTSHHDVTTPKVFQIYMHWGQTIGRVATTWNYQQTRRIGSIVTTLLGGSIVMSRILIVLGLNNGKTAHFVDLNPPMETCRCPVLVWLLNVMIFWSHFSWGHIPPKDQPCMAHQLDRARRMHIIPWSHIWHQAGGVDPKMASGSNALEPLMVMMSRMCCKISMDLRDPKLD